VVVVKCCQSGDIHMVKVSELAREDDLPISMDDLTEESSLVVDFGDDNFFPVQFIEFKGLVFTCLCIQ